MKNIITIQHTQSIHHTNGMVGSWTDWELSALGVQQANRIGEKLKTELSEKEFVMYSSDLLRAKQTAKIIGEHLGIVPIFRSELRERNLGKCCGKSVSGFEKISKQKKKLLTTNCFMMLKAAETSETVLNPFLME